MTTFVRTDTNTFREIVQRLTGPADHFSNASTAHEVGGGAVGPYKVVGTKRQTLLASGSRTLLERRQYNRNRSKLQIVNPTSRAQSMGSSSGEAHSLSTSPAITPTSGFSKLSLAQRGRVEPALLVVLDRQEEEKAIKERRFYLHSSPRSRTRTGQPELLDLFPATSPRLAGMDPGGG